MGNENVYQAAQGTVQVGRFSIPYRVYGQQCGRPIVCVNGLLMSTASWRPIVNMLRAQAPVVLFDLPGQGRAQHHSGLGFVSLDEQSEVLDHIVQQVAPTGSVTLFGVSWGSVVASAYAAHAGSKIRHLLLTSFGLKATPSLSALIERGRSAVLNGEAWRCGELLAASLGTGLPRCMGARIREQFQRMDADRMNAFYEHITWARTAAVEEYIELAHVRARTLVINGARDCFIDPLDAVKAQRHMHNCSVIFIPDTGHFLHLEQTGILPLYRDFLLHGRLPGNSCKHLHAQPLPNLAGTVMAAAPRCDSFS